LTLTWAGRAGAGFLLDSPDPEAPELWIDLPLSIRGGLDQIGSGTKIRDIESWDLSSRRCVYFIAACLPSGTCCWSCSTSRRGDRHPIRGRDQFLDVSKGDQGPADSQLLLEIASAFHQCRYRSREVAEQRELGVDEQRRKDGDPSYEPVDRLFPGVGMKLSIQFFTEASEGIAIGDQRRDSGRVFLLGAGGERDRRDARHRTDAVREADHLRDCGHGRSGRDLQHGTYPVDVAHQQVQGERGGLHALHQAFEVKWRDPGNPNAVPRMTYRQAHLPDTVGQRPEQSPQGRESVGRP
jgi:hypothetical protein